MMDSAATFLHRQERKAIERRRHKEPIMALAPAYLEGRLGLLAITPARVLFAHRRLLRTPTREWARRGMTGAKLETKRYGIVHVGLQGGQTLRFELTHTDHKSAVMDALLGPRPVVDPIKALTRHPGKGPRKARTPMVDPLAHRGTPAHEAKLRDLVARGMMTQKEMDWQLGR